VTLPSTGPSTGPEKVAIVSGYFNPIHIGHLRMIKAAGELAPHLLVIVNNDQQQLLKKGRILMTEDDRLAIVSELRSVDEAMVAVDDDATVVASLRRVRELHPHAELLFCNGGDRSHAEDVPSAETHLTEEIGLRMVYGVGGEDKADSSSRINEELSRSDTPTSS
jgi:cytidyltransferase-like protein